MNCSNRHLWKRGFLFWQAVLFKKAGALHATFAEGVRFTPDDRLRCFRARGDLADAVSGVEFEKLSESLRFRWLLLSVLLLFPVGVTVSAGVAGGVGVAVICFA